MRAAAEDFFYNLDILYGGLGIGKLQFLIKKEKKVFSCNFFSIFGHLSPVPEFIDPVLGMKMIVFAKISPNRCFQSNPYPETPVSACFG